MSEEKNNDWVPNIDEIPDDYEVIVRVDDWILTGVLNDPFYNFFWWSDVAKSTMKPLVKRSSLLRELTVKAAEAAIASFYFGDEPIVQKKRIKYILGKSVDAGIDSDYEKEKMSQDDISYTGKECNRMYKQARARVFKMIESLEKLDDGGDRDYIERTVMRNQAFECAYLCMRTEDPEDTFYILWGLIDMFYEPMIKGSEGE